ncbi:unnamed protein product [Bursaphelenchus okinawaensis]|uniref:Uncharacterized protein n=1 Tax=Bursaphelenchus okinawaensis TaxID=465554 RepID=A0A811JS79_9BILA|nr:unnamed protein product [Bursaphelenchus okinawaensis]CAG9080684.1 unnamed protein product [Bursaphelenchus okinawaensis]
MHCLAWCTFLLALVMGHALVNIPNFYSNPAQLINARPLRSSNPVNSLTQEHKWKRRRATPIQISPFFYLTPNEEDTMVYIPPQSASVTE